MDIETCSERHLLVLWMVPSATQYYVMERSCDLLRGRERTDLPRTSS
jgi:hypothetical protein